MIEKADQHLEEWVQSVVGNVPVTLEIPSEQSTGHKIGVYLFEILQSPLGVGGNRGGVIRLELRYLITSWSQQPKEAHRALGQLLTSALESREYEVELAPMNASLWNAFKCAPRPCFVMRVPVYHDLPRPEISAVHAPPLVQGSASTSLFGTVYGPNQCPLAGASVEAPGLALSTSANVDGNFRFAMVPADLLPKEIRVRVKGMEHRHPLPAPLDPNQPIVIHVPAGILQPAS